MNMRLACDLCGSQPCMCIETECLACKGEGEILIDRGLGFNRGLAEHERCEDCDGKGEIKCDGPRSNGRCKFAPPPGIPGDYHCYCEAAWEAANERLYTEEPPLSADERHRMAWEQKQGLRSGRPL